MRKGDLEKRVARNIRRLALARKLPLTHLADFTGTSKAYLINVLACRRSPTLRWLARIAATLEVDPVELMSPNRSLAQNEIAISRNRK